MGKTIEKDHAYYDGHYVDSGLSLEERKRRTEESRKKSACLQSWDDVAEDYMHEVN